jgi:sortase A
VSHARRRLGLALVASGTLLAGTAGSSWARGALAREQVRAEWDARLARSARIRAGEVASAGQPVADRAPGAPIARLVIPSIGLDEVVVEGVGDDELNAGPGLLPISVAPGERGNAVISAHRDRHFNRLGLLAVGDTITTETLRGVQRWVVTSRQVVHRDRRAIADHGRTELTLTTCWPIRYFGPAPERLIIAAQPVTSRAFSSASAERPAGS